MRTGVRRTQAAIQDRECLVIPAGEFAFLPKQFPSNSLTIELQKCNEQVHRELRLTLHGCDCLPSGELGSDGVQSCQCKSFFARGQNRAGRPLSPLQFRHLQPASQVMWRLRRSAAGELPLLGRRSSFHRKPFERGAAASSQMAAPVQPFVAALDLSFVLTTRRARYGERQSCFPGRRQAPWRRRSRRVRAADSETC